MNTQPKKAASPFIINAILIGIFLVGLWIVIVAALEIRNETTLAKGALTVEAKVTEARTVTSRKRGVSYEVRYEFEAGGQRYTCKDETGRTNLWAAITQKAWEVARQKGAVEVAYLPADPWVNHAVARPSGLFGRIAGLVVGLLCMLPASLWAVSALRKRKPSAKSLLERPSPNG